MAKLAALQAVGASVDVTTSTCGRTSSPPAGPNRMWSRDGAVTACLRTLVRRRLTVAHPGYDGESDGESDGGDMRSPR